MSAAVRIAPLPAAPAQSAAAPAAGARPKDARQAELHRAAMEFESVLVRQLLAATRLGGGAEGPYGGMAVDALATGISKVGGLGLAQRIEEAVRQASAGPEKKTSG